LVAPLIRTIGGHLVLVMYREPKGAVYDDLPCFGMHCDPFGSSAIVRLPVNSVSRLPAIFPGALARISAQALVPMQPGWVDTAARPMNRAQHSNPSGVKVLRSRLAISYRAQ
jgi:hypothetical protein